MRQYIFAVGALLLVFCSWCLFSLGVHAEEPETPPETVEEAPAPSSVQVYDPAIYERLDAIQAVLEDISVALTSQNDQVETAVAPDYTGQLNNIDSTLSKIQVSTEMATAETAEPAALEKPFEEYTTTETLVLVVAVLLIVALFVWFIRQF